MVPGPDTGMASGYCLFGARNLHRLTRKLEKQIEGAKAGEDIEYVHRMRVASRRLRAAMPVFRHCFSGKEFKGWLKEVKNVTRSLGEARDLDVQISFLEGYLGELGDERLRTGVEYLLSSHRERRASLQPGLVSSLDVLKESTFLTEMKRACRQATRAGGKGKRRSHDLFSGAHFHIASRLDDLLEMSNCVHDETAVTRHHEMRIRAKWLRYTMEIFSDVYPDKLGDEISTMKKFQDALGDMHDYDVWTEYLPSFMNELRGSQDMGRQEIREIERGINGLLEYVASLRRSRYLNFVELWEGAIEDGFFEDLREKVQRGIFIGSGVLAEEGSSGVGIIADLHGNLPALDAVLRDARSRGISQFINAGDSLGYGLYTNQVVELLCNNGVLSIKGNYDLKVLGGKGGSKDPALRLVRRSLSRTGRSYLETLPERASLKLGTKKLLVVHGSPGSIRESVFPEATDPELGKLAAGTGADVIVMAHTHIPLSRKVDGVTFVNPGSVGRPYDGNPAASYAVLTTGPFSLEIIRVKYDVEKVIRDLRKSRLPEEYAQALLRSLPVDGVRKLDAELEGRSMRGRMAEVRRVAAGYCGTDSHSAQVRRIALKVFDQLVEIHGLSRRERYLLEAAALLHDIGWSEGQRGHHKTSMRLIMEDVELPLATRERLIIGSIARYHRKGPPRKKHYNYGKLQKEDRKVVQFLSGILRVADGMDYGHSSVVRDIRSSFDDDRVILTCTGRGDHQYEDQQVVKKRGLFERVFDRALRLEWSPR